MIRTILLGYDGSESAKDALVFALDLAGKYGARLHIVGVIRPPEFAEDVETEAMIESSERKILGLLRAVKEQAGSAGIAAETHVLVGHPAEQLVRYAEANAIDHIVVGHRGHTVFERWLIGSVARQVIAYAHCAVTVVRS